ncbi:mitochondrial carrier domain-containing protein [Syncephalastrum racemosum]|uniref:Mitochondrial carrier domain-containing protein n=1 Tax=Syncephalastrum racemosum TaxID=13706 RepID=A0A1X2HDE6_SYNRA|nr:mitochondrial carrier domain-containing protein [Syncephalastrum racemosum]
MTKDATVATSTSAAPSTTATTAISSTEKLISACLGAFLTSVLVTPMDVVKMRLQTQHVHAKPQHALFPSCSCMPIPSNTTAEIRKCLREGKRHVPTRQVAAIHECALHHHPSAALTGGTLDGIYKIVRTEGPASLWRGLSPALVMSVPSNVIYFVGYDYLREYIRPFMKEKDNYAPLVAGGFARTVAVTIVSPIELFRTRLQAATGVQDFQYVLQGVRDMMRKEGAKVLWRGLPPTLWRDVPFSAIYWMGYEQTKQALAQSSLLASELHTSFLAGALSGMFAAAVTTPFDVAKTRRQVDAGRDVPTLRDSRVPYILKQIYQQDGARGLFRGLYPRIAKVAPSCAIMISSYELGKKFFSQQHS